MTRVGNNLRHICAKYDIVYHDFNFNISHITLKLDERWKDIYGMNEENRRTGMQVRELVCMRDGLDEFVLNTGEITDILTFLTTS